MDYGCDVSLGSVKYNGYKNALSFLEDGLHLLKRMVLIK